MALLGALRVQTGAATTEPQSSQTELELATTPKPPRGKRGRRGRVASQEAVVAWSVAGVNTAAVPLTLGGQIVCACFTA